LGSSKIHITRRQFWTSLSAAGLTLPGLLRLEAARATPPTGRPKSLIVLFLFGGPSQIDMWDMKPDAPVEYRGEFRPIHTTVPGLQVCEHLPRMAALARHYSVIRTLHHTNRNHQPAGCWMLTGVNPRSDNAAQLRPRPDDPPALGAMAVRLGGARPATVPPFVMMPARLSDQGTNCQGQTGGWLGSAFDPLTILQDPAEPGFRIDALEAQQNISGDRLTQRRDLLQTLDRGPLDQEPGTRPMTEFQQQAFDLITSRRGQSAFDLSQEPPALRDRYGRTRFGQGCLLARRLIEAGARVVTVADCTMAGNHEWDTHSGHFKRTRDVLMPRLDLAYSALMQDLIDRGLLEDTVVYLGGEFGRTPRVGQVFSTAGATRDGRDHYPSCFSGVIAGGRIHPGMIHGASDSRASAPNRDPVTPEELTATLFAAMGLDPESTVRTRDNRPMPATQARPVTALFS
jgi:hypothetical protein